MLRADEFAINHVNNLRLYIITRYTYVYSVLYYDWPITRTLRIKGRSDTCSAKLGKNGVTSEPLSYPYNTERFLCCSLAIQYNIIYIIQLLITSCLHPTCDFL